MLKQKKELAYSFLFADIYNNDQSKELIIQIMIKKWFSFKMLPKVYVMFLKESALNTNFEYINLDLLS